MPVTAFRIAVKDGEPVQIPAEHLEKSVFLQKLLAEEQTDGVLDVDVSCDGVPYSRTAIEAIAKYVEHFVGLRPSTIPKPLPGTMDRYTNDWEKDFIKQLLKEGDVWQHDDLVEVLNVAHRLEIESLRNLLSGWVALQIDVLVKDKNMLDGAEAVRNFFNIPNEWDEEQMGHLKAEMEFYDAEKK